MLKINDRDLLMHSKISDKVYNNGKNSLH